MLQGDDLKKKISISWQLYISSMAVVATITAVFVRMQDADKQQELNNKAIYEKINSIEGKVDSRFKSFEEKLQENQLHLGTNIKEHFEFSLDEVSGLRSDWERRNAEVEKRLDKLEK